MRTHPCRSVLYRCTFGPCVWCFGNHECPTNNVLCWHRVVPNCAVCLFLSEICPNWACSFRYVVHHLFQAEVLLSYAPCHCTRRYVPPLMSVHVGNFLLYNSLCKSKQVVSPHIDFCPAEVVSQFDCSDPKQVWPVSHCCTWCPWDPCRLLYQLFLKH